MSEKLKDDIEYVKNLAEAGDRTPIPFAAILFFGGIFYLFYAAFSHVLWVKLGKIIHVMKFPDLIDSGTYQPFLAIFATYENEVAIAIFVGLVFFLRNYFFSFGLSATSNKAATSIWVGLALFAVCDWYSNRLFTQNQHNVLDLMDFFGTNPARFSDMAQYYSWVLDGQNGSTQIPRLIRLLAIGWWVTADMSAYKWTRLISIVGFVLSPILTYFSRDLTFNVFYTKPSVIIFFVLIPSAILMFQSSSKRTQT